MHTCTHTWTCSLTPRGTELLGGLADIRRQIAGRRRRCCFDFRSFWWVLRRHIRMRCRLGGGLGAVVLSGGPLGGFSAPGRRLVASIGRPLAVLRREAAGMHGRNATGSGVSTLGGGATRR